MLSSDIYLSAKDSLTCEQWKLSSISLINSKLLTLERLEAHE